MWRVTFSHSRIFDSEEYSYNREDSSERSKIHLIILSKIIIVVYCVSCRDIYLQTY